MKNIICTSITLLILFTAGASSALEVTVGKSALKLKKPLHLAQNTIFHDKIQFDTSTDGMEGGQNFGTVESVQECIQRRGLEFAGDVGGHPLHGYDSDGDYIVDDSEDKNRNCRCDVDETCWYMADTDDDGILDSDEADGCGNNPDPNCTSNDR
jgi:hypothetical protein